MGAGVHTGKHTHMYEGDRVQQCACTRVYVGVGMSVCTRARGRAHGGEARPVFHLGSRRAAWHREGQLPGEAYFPGEHGRACSTGETSSPEVRMRFALFWPVPAWERRGHLCMDVADLIYLGF